MELLFVEDKKFGYAGEIWKCARVLSDFISSERIKKLFNYKVVLEIGSGTGHCGITAATLNTKLVYLTDREENLLLLEKNYLLNVDKVSEIKIITLDWNNKLDYSNIKNEIDIIIASDIVYHGVNFKNIINTFDYFASNKTDILLAYNQRLNNDFFDLLLDSNKWNIKEFPKEMYNSDEGVILFYIKKIIK